MSRRLTIQLRWGSTSERLFVYKAEGHAEGELHAIITPGNNCDILLDCCGEPAAFDAISAGAIHRPTSGEGS